MDYRGCSIVSGSKVIFVIDLCILMFQMNQSQSELTLARSLIAERDSEIQRFYTTNNQVCFSKDLRFLIWRVVCGVMLLNQKPSYSLFKNNIICNWILKI